LLDSILSYIVKGLSVFLAFMPMRFNLWIGRRCGDLVYLFSGKRAGITYANLKSAFGHEKSPRTLRRITRKVYLDMAETFTEMFSMGKVDERYTEKFISVEHLERVTEAADDPEGMIFLSAHYGNWELCTVKSVHIGAPMYLLARDQKMQKTYERLNELREVKGNRVIRKGMDIKNIFRVLREGKTLGVLGDQNAGPSGKLLDFFGRPASHAVGPFKFAQKSGAVVLPCFIRRLKGPYHHVSVEEPMRIPRDADITPFMKKYIAQLEKHIRKAPSQWLWMHKKWKMTPLKRIMVLSDGKKGHLKQSLSIVELIKEYRMEEGHAPGDIQHEIIDIEFKSRLRKAVFNLCAPFFSSRDRGRLRKMKWALTEKSYDSAVRCYADVVISCGSSLAGVNRMMAIENNARNAIIFDPGRAMRKRFDLVIVPSHDAGAGNVDAGNTVTVDMAPNLISRKKLKTIMAGLDPEKWFRGQRRIGVMIGGDNRDYVFTPELASELSDNIKKTCEQIDACVYITTSRRTPAAFERILEDELSGFDRCALFVKGREDTDPGTVEKILAASDIAVVSGESISMVSEAASSGRPVMVYMPVRKAESLTKYDRFVEDLREKGYLVRVKPKDIPAEAADILRAKAAPPECGDDRTVSKELYRLF
jgi:KDO2-lipid IV(A) lauroyltransferase